MSFLFNLKKNIENIPCLFSFFSVIYIHRKTNALTEATVLFYQIQILDLSNDRNYQYFILNLNLFSSRMTLPIRVS